MQEIQANFNLYADEVIQTNWGKHAWFIDSEKNVVMFFEPEGG